ncbi:DUF2252 domain-containing protein [Thermoleophilia bacterium SCSIO 60948]|nr:DUF2252 domain-containing protein [Thermoleophilia bacterium SCSIO 60948]
MSASVEELRSKGKAARRETPRSSHEGWAPAPGRPDPVATLAADDAGRVPELLPLRYERVSASAFTFFRGAASIMAGDLAGTPASGFSAQLCGDAHLSNFGTFAAPDRELVFDINDFDETLPGPWEWDVKRLAASVEIAGRDREFDDDERRRAVVASVRGYREAMREFAGLGELELWYRRTRIEALRELLDPHVDRRATRLLERTVAKAGAKGHERALEKLTSGSSGGAGPRLASDPPLMTPIEELMGSIGAAELRSRLEALLDTYRATLPAHIRHLLSRYSYAHAARKVVGVGSVGTHAWVALFTGRDGSDPLFLQIKEAGSSVLEASLEPSAYEHHGRRVVEGQRLMQAAGDIMLGWMDGEGIDGQRRNFYVRQLWDGKGSAPIERMRPAGLEVYSKVCGAVLARAHARSGERIAIAAYLGSSERFDNAVADFAASYADQNERDHAALVAAIGPDGLPHRGASAGSGPVRS